MNKIIKNPIVLIVLIIITIFFGREMPPELTVCLLVLLISMLSYLMINEVLDIILGKKQQIRIEQLEARVHQLEARLPKDSSNSE